MIEVKIVDNKFTKLISGTKSLFVVIYLLWHAEKKRHPTNNDKQKCLCVCACALADMRTYVPIFVRITFLYAYKLLTYIKSDSLFFVDFNITNTTQRKIKAKCENAPKIQLNISKMRTCKIQMFKLKHPKEKKTKNIHSVCNAVYNKCLMTTTMGFGFNAMCKR